MSQANTSHEANKGNLAGYCTGFGLSLALTLLAYLLVTHKAASSGLLVGLVIVLAVIQLVVQLIFFLHLDRESKPRWNLVVLLFALMVVVIVVFGSLWIMYNLDYHHGGSHNYYKSPHQLIQDEGIKL